MTPSSTLIHAASLMIGAVMFSIATFKRLGWMNILALIGILLMIQGSMHAATSPTQTDLSDALSAARTAWDSSIEDVTVRLDPFSPCRLRDNPTVALVSVEQSTTTTRDEDGNVISESVTYRHAIRINSNCDWSDPSLSLRKVMIHELGHILQNSTRHSDSPRSIMYAVVRGDGIEQRITAEDRAKMVVLEAGK